MDGSGKRNPRKSNSEQGNRKYYKGACFQWQSTLQ